MREHRTPLSEPYVTIGQRIRAYRGKRGLSIQQLFDLMVTGGCALKSLTSLYGWEIGRERISVADLMVCADVLMVPLGALLPSIGRVRAANKADAGD